MTAVLRPERSTTFASAGAILRHTHPDLVVSKRKLRQADVIELVRARRESAQQTLGFASRPFVLCGLPIKKPKKGELLHERRNGSFFCRLQATRAMVCLGGRIDWCQSFSQLSPSGSKAERFVSGARQKCSTRSGCSKVALSTAA